MSLIFNRYASEVCQDELVCSASVLCFIYDDHRGNIIECDLTY